MSKVKKNNFNDSLVVEKWWSGKEDKSFRIHDTRMPE